jgi:hypothetical protein
MQQRHGKGKGIVKEKREGACKLGKLDAADE